MDQTTQNKQLRLMQLQTLLLAAILILLAAAALFLTAQIRDVGELVQQLDMGEINSAITAMTAAAEDLSNVDVEALNQLVASLETVAANLERTSNAITGIFGR